MMDVIIMNTGEPILSIVLTMNSLEFIMNMTSRLVMMHVIIVSKWIEVSPCSLTLTWLRMDLNWQWIRPCPSTDVTCLPGSHDACHHHELYTHAYSTALGVLGCSSGMGHSSPGASPLDPPVHIFNPSFGTHVSSQYPGTFLLLLHFTYFIHFASQLEAFLRMVN